MYTVKKREITTEEERCIQRRNGKRGREINKEKKDIDTKSKTGVTPDIERKINEYKKKTVLFNNGEDFEVNK